MSSLHRTSEHFAQASSDCSKPLASKRLPHAVEEMGEPGGAEAGQGGARGRGKASPSGSRCLAETGSTWKKAVCMMQLNHVLVVTRSVVSVMGVHNYCLHTYASGLCDAQGQGGWEVRISMVRE